MKLWTATTAGEVGSGLVRRLPAGDGLDLLCYGSGLGDLVEACDRCGGGCHVDVAAWTWRRDDASAWGRAVRAGLIVSGRFLTDETRLHPFQIDVPSLVACFPVDAIRMTHCHVKGWFVRGSRDSAAVMRTAEDPRLVDWWTLTPGAAVVDRWVSWFDAAWAALPVPDIEHAAVYDARAVSPGLLGAVERLRAWWPDDRLGDVLDALRVDDDGVAADTLASGSAWSLVDAVGEVARRLGGEVDVDLAVWRLAARESRKLARIGARRCRVVYGIVRREIATPELVALRAVADQVLVCRNHAKMAIVRGGGRVVCLLTSANPTLTGRLESWQCRTGAAASFWSGWFDHAFSSSGPAPAPLGRDSTRRLLETYR